MNIPLVYKFTKFNMLCAGLSEEVDIKSTSTLDLVHLICNLAISADLKLTVVVFFFLKTCFTVYVSCSCS